MGNVSGRLGELARFWEIPERDCVIKITVMRDLEYAQTPDPASAVPAALGDLQVKADPLAVDQDRSRINQLLSGAVVALVAAQCGEREKELHRFRVRSGSRLGGEMKRAAESHPVKLRIVFEIAEHGAD